MDEMTYEKQKLAEILNKYDEYVEDTKLEYKNVYKLYQDKEQAEKKHNELKNKISTLNANINKPYFARIDFSSDNGNNDICYIGKIGISNYDNEIVVVDWRAPISSLYYDSNLGQTEYQVNNDIITGQLTLKRQYEIENRQLINFNNVDTVSNDELLKPYLSVGANSRTKNIVATIQKEQNEIIRSDISNNIIVQGVAGSGKTTVALHRIAYLVYNYRELISNNQYMVIGPNKFFINFISKILPELDVNDVPQYDLQELAENYLDEKLTLLDDYNTLEKNNISKLPKIKTSLIFKKILDNYFTDYYQNILSKNNLCTNGFVIIKNKIIRNIWDEVLKRNYDNLKELVDRCVLLLNKYFEENIDNILQDVNIYIEKMLEKGEKLDKCRKLRENIISKIKSNSKSMINNYFKPMFKSPTMIYKDFKRNISKYTDDSTIINNINESLYFEDLPALMYINYKLYGSKNFSSYKHVVIDEAQDYNDFTFYVLKKILSKSSFSIYGDIAQSIYSYRSLDNWDSIKKYIFKNAEIKNLNKSYRTTIEIMNEANKINKHLNLLQADAVIRHGDKVLYEKIKRNSDIILLLQNLIKKENHNIAIITKNSKQAIELNNILKDVFDIKCITDKVQEYSDGICIMPCYLCKGLEFDGVIIYDASNINYDENNILDMKLLYVAMTRALHNLIITYKQKLPLNLDI